MATTKTSLGFMDDDWSRAIRGMSEAMKPMIETQEILKSFNHNWINQMQDIQRAMLPSLAMNNYIKQQTSEIQSIVSTALSQMSEGIANVLNSTMMSSHFKISDSMSDAIRRMRQINELVSIPKLSFAVPEINLNIDTSNAISAALRQLNIDMSPIVKSFRDIKVLDFSMIDWDALKSLRAFSEDDGIQINSDGTISISGVASNVQDVAEAVNQCIRESSQLDAVEAIQRRNIREIILNKLISLAKTFLSYKTGKAVTLFIFYIIVDILVQNTLCPLAKPYTDRLNTYLEKTTTRTIKKQTTTIASLDRNALKGFRFVTKSRLLVRARGRMRSHVIGELTLGQVVQVVYKNKNWTQVQYINPVTDECICGWVLTRYISRFK